MIKVYIPLNNTIPIYRQFCQVDNFVWGNCEFVFNDSNDYDYLVVLDGIDKTVITLVNKQHRLLFLGEPPHVKEYTKKFRKQFGYVYSCQRSLINNGHSKRSYPMLPWMIGCSYQNNLQKWNNKDFYDYIDFKNIIPCHNINKACLITSNKNFTQGHRNRVKFVEYILSKKLDFIDVYGNGYKPIPDKLDVLTKYKYAVIIENCSYPDYWTEKLSDCFLAGSYPLYYGAPNISDYFDEGSYTKINILEMDKAISIIKSAIDNNLYELNKKSVSNAKNLVMDKYNMFAMIANEVDKIEKKCMV